MEEGTFSLDYTSGWRHRLDLIQISMREVQISIYEVPNGALFCWPYTTLERLLLQDLSLFFGTLKGFNENTLQVI